MNTLPIHPDAPWLAPLAGYSDLPFRMLCRHYGCMVTCTEMVSAKGLYHGGGNTDRLLDTCPDDEPVVLQLFGSDPDVFPYVMDSMLERGFRYFDLNCGCPVRKVLKSGSGSALLMDTDKLLRIARIMIERAGPGRAGFKIRLGYETGDDVFTDLARRLEDAGAAWITLHPRSARQMFSGRADWSRLPELVRAVSIPVVASGDLFTAEDGVRCIEQTGVAGLMFARGAMYDPSVFRRYLALRRGETVSPLTGRELEDMVRLHIRYTRELDGTPRSFRKIRSFIPRYAKGLGGVRALRSRLTQCETWEELDEAVSTISELPPALPETAGEPRPGCDPQTGL